MKLQYYGKVKQKDYWQTIEDLYYNTRYGVIKVPAGFIYDGISIPHFLWIWKHPLIMPILYWAILHDFLYSNKSNKLNRKEADITFLDGTGSWIMYFVVRLFGGLFYKKSLPFNKK